MQGLKTEKVQRIDCSSTHSSLQRYGIRLISIVAGIASAVLAAAFVAVPARAAEQIYFNYGPLEFSVSVHDLEAFATEGSINPELGFFLDRLSSQQQAQLRSFLQMRFELSPVIASRVMYSATGVRLLTRVGDLIETQSGQNGLYGIRSAIALATADPEGLTIINFLRKFPTDIRLNTTQIISFVGEAMAVIRDTDAIVAELQQKTAEVAASEPAIDYTQLPDLRNPGDLRVTQQTFNWQDSTRDRQVTTELYLPENASQAQLPVIVFSNGLGARRDRYAKLAQHLASYGFAIVIPDHVGSNDQRQKAFFAGLHPENFDASDYIDRPLDVTFVLNQLEQLNLTQFHNQLNLQQVGIFGYSLGGTTALSLAGAEINFSRLEKECTPPINILNISTLYQCRVLELPHQIYKLRDRRIKAAFIFVPSGKSLFGSEAMSQVDIPIFWQVTDQDIITPLVLEQLPFFSGLNSPDRYLSVSRGLPHTRVTVQLLDRLMNTDRAESLDQLTAVTDNYLSALSLAFLKVYVAEDSKYRPYLEATYTQALTEAPYQLSLLRSVAFLHQ